MKCKCEYQKTCSSGVHSNWSINLYDTRGLELIKPLAFLRGSCKQAQKKADVLSVRHNCPNIGYDHA